MQTVKGRDFTGKRFSVYRARVPDTWIRRDPLPKETLTDTTKPLCEYIIRSKDGLVRIAIHNFPTDTIEQRIPPEAQAARWKRQFSELIPTKHTMAPQAFNGYVGLMFKGEGTQKNTETTVLAWSLSIAPEHYRALTRGRDEEESQRYREMRADVTIKAVGPPRLVEANEEDIVQFARSFELIEEIPPGLNS